MSVGAPSTLDPSRFESGIRSAIDSPYSRLYLKMRGHFERRIMQKMALRPPGNRWSEGRERWGLVAPDAPELHPILLHLFGEGVLGPAERFGDGMVGNFVIVHPHGDNGVRVRVKLP